tara:strand:+ start:256 stop:468 length:213 start_codon:yes stop_codon:yes gene_type:complete
MVNVGDLCWDIVTETLWIISNIWWCGISDDYKYDLTSVTIGATIVTNDQVAIRMRADFIKRTKNVLYKSQ